MLTEEKTYFGYQMIPTKDKTEKVKSVFHSVANQYDLMNDLMSLGIHRIWKKIAVAKLNIQSHHTILDLAGGTGDLTKEIAKYLKDKGQVVLADINHSMLQKGRERLLNLGFTQAVQTVEANAENLAFDHNTFDSVIIAFGLRNVTIKEKALAEIFRVLKPSGRMVILEFSHPEHDLISKIYDFYSFNILPLLGKIVTGGKQSYDYLVESIRMHPNQETLCNMMSAVGFENCQFQNLTGGIVAIHTGFKF